MRISPVKILFGKLPHQNELLSLALFQSQEYNLALHINVLWDASHEKTTKY